MISVWPYVGLMSYSVARATNARGSSLREYDIDKLLMAFLLQVIYDLLIQMYVNAYFNEC